jgi:hypothetical protein
MHNRKVSELVEADEKELARALDFVHAQEMMIELALTRPSYLAFGD